jgi:hypothetical protein
LLRVVIGWLSGRETDSQFPCDSAGNQVVTGRVEVNTIVEHPRFGQLLSEVQRIRKD